MRNCYLDEFINGLYPAGDSQYTMGEERARDMGREQPILRVIARGSMLARDSNKAIRNYNIFSMTSSEMAFKISTTKKAKTR